MSKNKPRPRKDPEPELEILRQEEEVEELAQEQTAPGEEEEDEAEEETAEEEASSEAVSESRGAKVVRFFSSLPAEKARLISGFLCLFLGVFLLVSLVSHFLYWWIDFDLVQQMQQGSVFAASGSRVRNWGGNLGAYTAFALVNNGFGIASFIFPLILLQAGLHLLMIRRFRWVGIFFRSCFGLLWISTLMGMFFKNGTRYIFAGGAGVSSAGYLQALTGFMGLAAILLFTLICYFIINYNVSKVLRKMRGNRVSRDGSGKVEDADLPPALPGGDSLRSSENAGETPALHSEEDDPLVNFTISGTIGLPVDAGEEVDEAAEVAAEAEFSLEVGTGDAGPEARAPYAESDELLESSSADEMQIIDLRAAPAETGSEKDLRKIQDGDHIGIDTPFDPRAELSDYKFPTLDLLDDFGDQTQKLEDMKKELQENKDRIVQTLRTFNIEISKISATIGPTVTLYEIVPAPGIRIGKIKNLEEDIALSLAALGIRIIAPIPGKGTIGIEVPNNKKQIVPMRDMLTCAKFVNSKAALPIALGKTISNEEYVADLAKMPHLLVAGATGQGKSVGLNAIIASLLYSKHPAELKFVMVDPKKVELSLFNKIERHYLAKLPEGDEEAVITDTRKVVRTLSSLCIEMDNRYLLLKDAGVKKIDEYNKKFTERRLNPAEAVGTDLYHHYLPYIVLIIDEFADLIMTAGKEVEMPIARLAQLARAVGIHLVIATQRPSVNIITGIIKANFPARIAFKVQSQIDSRTILDTNGANQLIGRGDMLISAGDGLTRVQCALIDTPEIERIADFIGEQRAYPTAFMLPEVPDENGEGGKAEMEEGDWDPMFREAAEFVVSSQQSSTSILQRKFKLGYNRAGRITDQLEAAGIVSGFEGGRKVREVKVKDPAALEEIFNRLGIQ